MEQLFQASILLSFGLVMRVVMIQPFQ